MTREQLQELKQLAEKAEAARIQGITIDGLGQFHQHGNRIDHNSLNGMIGVLDARVHDLVAAVLDIKGRSAPGDKAV